MQGQRQRESVRQRESEERMGGQERGKKDLDCIIDYPITAAGLWNCPSPRSLSHIQSAPELQIHARLSTEDGEWPSEATRRMAKALVEADIKCSGGGRGLRLSNASSEEMHPVADSASRKYYCHMVSK